MKIHLVSMGSNFQFFETFFNHVISNPQDPSYAKIFSDHLCIPLKLECFLQYNENVKSMKM